MRFVFGIIVGCLLTIGIAYVHDAAQPPGPTPVVAEALSDGRMVNWDVVNHNFQGVSGWVQAQWSWITGKLNKPA